MFNNDTNTNILPNTNKYKYRIGAWNINGIITKQYPENVQPLGLDLSPRDNSVSRSRRDCSESSDGRNSSYSSDSRDCGDICDISASITTLA